MTDEKTPHKFNLHTWLESMNRGRGEEGETSGLELALKVEVVNRVTALLG